MTTPTPFQIAYRDLLIELHDWREEHEAERVKLYAEALANNQITPRDERTKRKARCDVCLRQQEPGMRTYDYAGDQQYKVNVCDGCMDKIINSTRSARE